MEPNTANQADNEIMAEIDRRMSAMDAEEGASPATPAPVAPVEPGSDPAKVEAGAPNTDEQQPQTEPADDPLTQAEARQAEADNPDKSKPSRFQKRKDEIQAQLAEAKAAREKLNTERAELEQQRRQFDEQRKAAEAAKPQFSPEDYDSYAAKQEAKAQALEEAGQFDEANELKGLGQTARREAKRLRENPPSQQQQAARSDAQFEAAAREWTGKAFTDFPDVKPGGKLNVELQEFIKAEPDVLSHPKGLYFAAELIAQKSSALRVPDLMKQVKELTAKVQELEGLTSPDPGGSGQTSAIGATRKFDDMTIDEQREELRRMSSSPTGR